MNSLERIVGGLSGRLRNTNLTFGLREAAVVSIVGIAIASAVGYHFAT